LRFESTEKAVDILTNLTRLLRKSEVSAFRISFTKRTPTWNVYLETLSFNNVIKNNKERKATTHLEIFVIRRTLTATKHQGRIFSRAFFHNTNLMY
jgi:hypothetical protein